MYADTSACRGDREHLPRSLAHDLIEHRTALGSLGSASSWTTLSMAYLPDRRANAGT
jgi:hypothetical protein